MRLIDADALEKRIKDVYCSDCENYDGVRCRACQIDDALIEVDAAPTITPESLVKRGRWEYDGMTGTMDNPLMRNYCSVCEMVVIDAEEQKFRFCPYCGAKMEED